MIRLFAEGPNFVDWINNGGSPATERNLGGVVPAYPIFMFIGIIAVIIASIIKMKQRNIPLAELEWGILIVVPVGIIGGTIFGKIFIPNMIWYHVFFFWEPGMSLFGALAFGTVAGFSWFYRRSKITKISVWVYADCILPNILLGQAIGRWGNFYNHEILGQVVDYDSLSWLIPSIRDKLWYFPKEIAEVGPLPSHWWTLIIHNGNLDDVNQIVNNLKITPENAKILHDALSRPLEYRQPLFLYESLCNFFWWLILTFFVANLSRFFQRKHHYPWDIQPKAFPGWYNHKYKSLPQKEIILWTTQIPVKYKRVVVKKGNQKALELSLTLNNAWNKAYYLYELDDQTRSELFTLVDQQHQRIEQNEMLLEKSKTLHKKDVAKIKHAYQKKLALTKKHSQKANLILEEKNQALKTERQAYLTKKQTYRNNLGGRWYQIKPNPLSRQIEHAFNPHNFFILRCGVLSGAYVFGYTFYRLILETLRDPREYFIQNYAVANFIVLGLIVAMGVGIMIWAQFGAPYKYRDLGWLYEKSY